MPKNFRESLKKQLDNEAFRQEYEALEPEFQIIKALLEGRKSKSLTQKQLSEITGIDQADISKLETGNGNPSLKTLERLANGLDMSIRIEFIPKKASQ